MQDPRTPRWSRNKIAAAAGLVFIVVFVWFFWDDITEQPACPANSSPNSDGSSCVCDTGFNSDAAPFTGRTNGLCEPDHQPIGSGCVAPDCAPTPDLAGNVAGARGVTVGNLGRCNPSTAADGGVIATAAACEAASGTWTPYTQSTRAFCMGPWTDQCMDADGAISDMVDGVCPDGKAVLPRHPTGCPEEYMTYGCPQTCVEISNPCVPTSGAAPPQGESCHIIEDQGVQKCSEGCQFDPSRQASCTGNADPMELPTCTGQPTSYCVAEDTQHPGSHGSPLQACKGSDGLTTMTPDETSHSCEEGCIPYTPPDCSFIEHEDGRLACPTGCDFSEASSPLCDLDFRTDPDDSLCPRGCILTQGALCMSECGFSQCDEQATCSAKHGIQDDGACALATDAVTCAAPKNDDGVSLCTYSKLSSTCRDCLNNCSNDDTACLETCTTNQSCPGEPCIWSSDGSCPAECTKGTSEDTEIRHLKIEWHQAHPESGQSPTQVPVMFAEIEPGSTIDSITINLPQDRAGDAFYGETQATRCPDGSDPGAPVFYEGSNAPAHRILCGCWSPCTEACENNSGSLEITGLEAQQAGIDEWWERTGWEEASGIGGTWNEGGISGSWGAEFAVPTNPQSYIIGRGEQTDMVSLAVPNTWQTRRFMPVQYEGGEAGHVCQEQGFLKHPKMVYPPPCHGGDGGCKNCNDAQHPFGLDTMQGHDNPSQSTVDVGRWISIPPSMYDALDENGQSEVLQWLAANTDKTQNDRVKCRIMNDHEYTTRNYKGIEPICIATTAAGAVAPTECTGTADDGSSTCDLLADTDGTAECPAGCAHNGSPAIAVGDKIDLPLGPECAREGDPAAASDVPTECTGLWGRYANVGGMDNLGTTRIACPPSRFCPAEDGACEAAGGEWRTRGASWIQCDEWTDPAYSREWGAAARAAATRATAASGIRPRVDKWTLTAPQLDALNTRWSDSTRQAEIHWDHDKMQELMAGIGTNRIQYEYEDVYDPAVKQILLSAPHDNSSISFTATAAAADISGGGDEIRELTQMLYEAPNWETEWTGPTARGGQLQNMCACPAGHIFEQHNDGNKFRCIKDIVQAWGDSHRILQDYGSMGLRPADSPPAAPPFECNNNSATAKGDQCKK